MSRSTDVKSCGMSVDRHGDHTVNLAVVPTGQVRLLQMRHRMSLSRANVDTSRRKLFPIRSMGWVVEVLGLKNIPT